uniref:Uncharacterized protein n=1 Tax=Acrobeloides nanus TaxID=290746 RepID=A0A914CVU1_9BILA
DNRKPRQDLSHLLAFEIAPGKASREKVETRSERIETRRDGRAGRDRRAGPLNRGNRLVDKEDLQRSGVVLNDEAFPALG